MPAYNASLYISFSILSVLNQSYKNWELIIVNDGSTDETKKIVENFLSDPRIKFIDLPRNNGVANARNKAISISSGDIISFLDADDLWHKDKLAIQKVFFDKGHKVVYSPFKRILPNKKSKLVLVKKSVVYEDFFSYNPIANLTGSFRRELLPIEQKNIVHEDYVMWSELVKKNGSAISTDSDIALGYYRVTNKSISSSKIKSAYHHWIILRYVFNLSLYKTIIYFCKYFFRSFAVRFSDYL